MQQAIIVELKTDRPIAKGEVVHDCPGYTYLKITKLSKHFAPKHLQDKDCHKFNKEFYETELLK